ncbi:MAG: YwiC-like family protein [Chloroflexi bacterium]|nr:YwiC-like family protein [Chloroflexota bacterium]
MTMESKNKTNKYFRRHIAIPSDHGAWVFLLSPLLIGIFAAGNWTSASTLVIIAALAAFLLRQPLTIAVKAYSGRRSRGDLSAAWFWMIIYGLVIAAVLVFLTLDGFGYLFWLGIPGAIVFIWYLWLVSKRSERRQMVMDILASGSMALAAPAALWTSLGNAHPDGWWLWLLTWLQSAASIVYAFMRLEQRNLTHLGGLSTRLRQGRQALLLSSFNLAFLAAFSSSGKLPALLYLPFGLQWLETIWGTMRPAIGIQPVRIGMRQLAVSTLFTILFIVVWTAK